MDATFQTLLEVKDLSVAFRQGERETLAVDRVSFEIKKGETVALVGEFGSGKSVTALSVMKLLPYPAARHPSGSIRFKGQELLGLPEDEIRHVRGNDITIIFQEPMTSLNPLHTIEKQIGEILLLHQGLTGAAARARIIELLTQVGIPEAETRLASYPHQLSGGQRQRVMIAMALANEPDLLIADEPTTALDVTVQAQILTLLKELQQRLGMAMLFITHDLGIVRKLADTVCVMKEGKIVEQGPVERVFTAPEHPYTRALLAAEPKPDPAPINAGCAGRGRDQGPQGLVSDQARRHAPGRRPHQGGRRREHRGAPGRDARHRGRIRLRQDHAGLGHSAAGVVGRADRLSRQQDHRADVPENAAVPPSHADRVPGPLRLALAAHVGIRHHRGGLVGASPEADQGAARGTGDPGAARGRPRSRDALSLSARILRRPAPAHRGRPRQSCWSRPSSCSTSRPARSTC